MTLRARSTVRMMRSALAAATVLALGACANAPDTRPDKPFRTADQCIGSAIPEGWIRTNDWRGKGCGVEDSAGAREQKARIQLASAAAPPKAKAKAKAKAKPKADVSRGANAVAAGGPNNWMTIAEIAHARIGRSLTVCAGAVPDGWVERADAIAKRAAAVQELNLFNVQARPERRIDSVHWLISKDFSGTPSQKTHVVADVVRIDVKGISSWIGVAKNSIPQKDFNKLRPFFFGNTGIH